MLLSACITLCDSAIDMRYLKSMSGGCATHVKTGLKGTQHAYFAMLMFE